MSAMWQVDTVGDAKRGQRGPERWTAGRRASLISCGAVEVCDPEGRDQTLGHFEEQLEDDDEPITAVENLEERLALALEGADFEIEHPAVSVASAIVLYLVDRLSFSC